nr:reverse transcriptase domain-containing protein [Tanacetum cinerariifolium]
MEKLVLSLVFAAKRLRRYFQAYLIAVITDQPIKQVMSRPDAAGRLQKWSIMLGEHNITYRPRTSIKGQILADFLNEIPNNALQSTSDVETQEEPWTLFTDGSSSNQVLGTYEAKEDNMIKYLEIAKGLVSGFKTFSINQVPRSKNKKADALSKIASTSFAHLSKQVLVEVLDSKSITGKEVTAVIEEEGPTWMTELVNYLKEGTLPVDEKEARKIRLKARQYELIEGIFYKRSFLTPWLRCVGPLQAEYLIKEIHEGSCSMHAGPRTSIKGQILADFLNKIPSNTLQGTSAAETQEEPWTLFTDGSSCVDGSGAGLILTNPDGIEFTYALRFQFAASNNEAEYEALIAGLRIATQMGVKNIQANVDSKLVANQVLGTYVAKEDNMIKYLEIAKGLVSGFKTFSICQVPRSKNKKADALSKIASTSFAHLSK